MQASACVCVRVKPSVLAVIPIRASCVLLSSYMHKTRTGVLSLISLDVHRANGGVPLRERMPFFGASACLARTEPEGCLPCLINSIAELAGTSGLYNIVSACAAKFELGIAALNDIF